MLESVQLMAIVMTTCVVGAIVGGYALLKIYDAFRTALKTNNRAHLWLACVMAMFALIVTVVVFTSFGFSIQRILSRNNQNVCLQSTWENL